MLGADGSDLGMQWNVDTEGNQNVQAFPVTATGEMEAAWFAIYVSLGI
jgi:hypothetical protein